jgi:hypothetical protein
VANPNAPQPLPGEDPNAGTPGLVPGTNSYQKEEVGYRQATDAAQSCSNCAHFIRKAQQSLGQGMCDVVAGPISPNGVSDMFTPVGGLQSLTGPPPA